MFGCVPTVQEAFSNIDKNKVKEMVFFWMEHCEAEEKRLGWEES